MLFTWLVSGYQKISQSADNFPGWTESHLTNTVLMTTSPKKEIMTGEMMLLRHSIRDNVSREFSACYTTSSMHLFVKTVVSFITITIIIINIYIAPITSKNTGALQSVRVINKINAWYGESFVELSTMSFLSLLIEFLLGVQVRLKKLHSEGVLHIIICSLQSNT